MTEKNHCIAQQIRVQGIVQGVGFRPFVWHLAQQCQLKGEVWNDAGGVTIQAWGQESDLEQFLFRLENQLPPLAQVDQISAQPLSLPLKHDDFIISESREGQVQTHVSPDAATCPACLSDILDPNNRRYRYPFTNCTHCGPRLSIIQKIPYDRQNTSMRDFPLCESCLEEYQNPADRRFHAQPNACHDCGPQIWLEDANHHHIAEQDSAIDATAKRIKAGTIVAIKGLGGIHLACDATHAAAVNTLRQRKQRYGKAFALMAKDIAMVQDYARVNDEEAHQLSDKSAPIVILNPHPTTNPSIKPLAPGIAPGQNGLGFILPYTPLHHLLMACLNHPIVLTSGNRSDEPQCIDNHESVERLKSIADYYLLHNRAIVNRLDDSVMRSAGGKIRMIRRARGFAPAPLKLPAGFESSPQILAMGAELKNTFCLLKDGQAMVSQHMGDLENAPTLRDYHHNLELYQQLFQHHPELIVVDKHPDYFSSQTGRQISHEQSIDLLEAQHHHAHIAAVMAEHQLPRLEPTAQNGKASPTTVLGIALDGLGFGEDKTIWGGEFLLCDYADYQRLAWFNPVPMLGGAKAMYEPWRNTLAHLLSLSDWEELASQYAELDIIQFLHQKPLATLKTMAEKGLNSPPASSAGRLFDAVAAALNICRGSASFEGQAAIELESLAETTLKAEARINAERSSLGNPEKAPILYREKYPAYQAQIVASSQGYFLDWQQTWRTILQALSQKHSRGDIAACFHLAVAESITEMVECLKQNHPFNRVVLSGGVFQNRILLEQTTARLLERGFEVLSPSQLPANDGGLSLGQAVIGAARFAQKMD